MCKALRWGQQPQLVTARGARASTEQRDALGAPRGMPDMRAYVESHHSSLEDAAASARVEAAAAVAKAQVDVPVTLSQWSDWISSRRDMFGELMRTAPEHGRRLCRRLGAADGTPSPVRRIALLSTGASAAGRHELWLLLPRSALHIGPHRLA